MSHSTRIPVSALSAYTRRWTLPLCLAATAAVVPAQPPAARPGNSSPVVLDRVVAVVNKHSILTSDLDEAIRLSILNPDRSGGGVLTPQRALDQLISRSLIEQQIRQEDMPAIEPSQEEVHARIAQLRQQLPACVHLNCATDAGWKAFLDAQGLTPDRVETYIRYRLEILNFIEQRFRQGIQIAEPEIEKYYRETLLPQYAPGETAPPINQVAPRIQEILLEQQVNILFDNWLTNLRLQGDVEVLAPELESTEATPGAQKGES